MNSHALRAYGTLRNETKRNGTLRNGTLRNGTLRNGTLRNGTLRNDTLRNGTLVELTSTNPLARSLIWLHSCCHSCCRSCCHRQHGCDRSSWCSLLPSSNGKASVIPAEFHLSAVARFS